MIDLADFHQDFLQHIFSDAESRGLLRAKAFFENVCEELLAVGELTKDYTSAEYKKTGLEVHGYDYDEERHILSLLVHNFFQDETLQTLTQSDIDTKFRRVRNFYDKCLNELYSEMEESYESYSMAYQIYKLKKENKIDKVKFVIITDGKATRNLQEIPSENIDNIEFEYRVIDIQYLHKIYLSENSSGEFDVDVKIPFLEIDTESDDYQSYLSFMTGNSLVKIYEEFGQKLFEQNVRTFLQFRGNVNKGLRNTIQYSPEMFFAYNNGITATATEVEVNNNVITKIKNFQIVNGGQTTSAIYAAHKNSKIDVSKISVQMKLSVVNNTEKQADFVSKVSEYANTQNKVNKSDFFSNSPFHKQFKDHSNRIWVAPAGGVQQRTHWYYERVRGEYLNAQAYLSPAEKRGFKIANPKHQQIDKTFLAKSEISWLQEPHIASKGAQYSFSRFAEKITKNFERENFAITENYFKDAICRIIIFRYLEKMISNSDWYSGGYRAQCVTYTMAYLSKRINDTKKFLNFNLIWEKQNLPNELIDIFKKIAKAVYQEMTNPSEDYINIAQWCKQEKCWKQNIKYLNIPIEIDEELLIDSEEEIYIKIKGKKKHKLLTGIEMQTFVVQAPRENWLPLYKYFEQDGFRNFRQIEIGVLESMANGRITFPSEKQSKILYKLYQRAEEEGFAC